MTNRTHSQAIRDVVQIGQVWEHHEAEFCIQIKQIHRADRLVEARIDAQGDLSARQVTFAELSREYELVR